MFVIKSRNKRLIMCIMCLILIFTSVYAGMSRVTCIAQERTQGENSGIELKSPSAILMEASTGQVIYEKDADKSLHPASITKIMTLILIFDAIKDGKIGLDDEVTVSEYAASMGGSQVFLEAGEKQTVDTMIKCISMASANDACVAMSEYIAGTESAFVAKMNERATGLGMNNTNFVNCCGLDTDGHMSTARDIALMSRELITKYPQIHDYSTIWMDTIIHSTRRGDSEFGLTNTNKLIKQYEWATGLKTGSTGLAKCCLSASANKDGIDLIAVIMAAPDSKTRFAEAVNLLNYGFNTCDIYKDDGMPLLENIRISKGKKDYVNCRYEKEFSYMFINPVNHEDISKELHINENIAAPVYEGDTIGTLEYYYNGEKIGSVNVISSENIEKADFLTQIKKVLGRLLK
ncbi:MAG: D-alanyl-D-alanine carboxypeptidase [Lachnospira sp.]|jgi:serine-type D-Ala-D-Ala carboxypeptidase (penicillin-binding protein 5/6)|nr:D-alanyl-D-alanine carboxypeptidase [Lachnospira sp.]